jgi:hypothetical protein
MAERLALCLVLRSLLPDRARGKRGVIVKSLAREAERAAKHLADHGGTQPTNATGLDLSAACSRSNSAHELSDPAQETALSTPTQDKMQSSSHNLPFRILSAAGGAMQTEWKHPYHSGGKETQLQLASFDDEAKAWSTSFDNINAVDCGPGPPTPPVVLKPCASGGAKRDGNRRSDAQEGRPPHTVRCNPGNAEGTPPPWDASAEAKAGSGFGAEQDHSASPRPSSSFCLMSGATGRLPSAHGKSMSGSAPLPRGAAWVGSGDVEASAPPQGRQTMQKKRKPVLGAMDGLPHKVARHSRAHTVCDLSERSPGMSLLAEMGDDDPSSLGAPSPSLGVSWVPEPSPRAEEEKMLGSAPASKGAFGTGNGDVQAGSSPQDRQPLQEITEASRELPVPLPSATGVRVCSVSEPFSCTGQQDTQIQLDLGASHDDPRCWSSSCSPNSALVEVGPETPAPPSLADPGASPGTEQDPNQGRDAQQGALPHAERASPGESGGAPLPCDASAEGILSTDGLPRQAAQDREAEKVCRLSICVLLTGATSILHSWHFHPVTV